MVIDNAIMVFCGTDSKSFHNYLDFGKIYVGDAIITWTQIIILAVGFTLMIALSIIVYKTKIGKAMTAIAQNQDAAKLMGIDTNRVISLTFIISGFLACIAGTMVAMYYSSIETTMGFLHRHENLCGGNSRRRRRAARRSGGRPGTGGRGNHGLGLYQHGVPRCDFLYGFNHRTADYAKWDVRQEGNQQGLR